MNCACGATVEPGQRFCSSCGRPANSDAELTADLPRASATASLTPASPSSSSASSTAHGRFLPGTMLAGRYRVVALLGAGGMGEVYRADDLTLGQPVALKFLPEKVARDAYLLERFRNEVRVARRVSHPNVCRVYDVGEVEGTVFLSMEYVDGEDLASLLRRIGRLPGDKALDIARQLCAGLAAAHREGVLHRDLKPANIMLDGRGRAVMMDFGLAGLAEQITAQDVRSGTPAYMAPEQLAGREVTQRSDIYALGLVMYEIFTGKRPHSATTLAELASQRELRPPSTPSSLVRDLDPAVERVILRCLEPNPADRPPSAIAAAAALPGGDPLADALAAGETPSPQLVAAAGETVGISPRAAMISLALVLLGMVITVFAGTRNNGLEALHADTSPEVLSAKAREIIGNLGYQGRGMDTAQGFVYSTDLLDYVATHDKPKPRWQEIVNQRTPVLQFWYRQSPRPMLAYRVNTLPMRPSTVTDDDPPQTESGMINLRLDLAGHLIKFQAIPPERESDVTTHAVDWAPLFAAAGLDVNQLQPAQPEWNSLAGGDTRAAWTGVWPGTDRPLRVEAAALHGAPVFFRLMGPWTKPARMPSPDSSGGLGNTVSIVLVLALLVGSVQLARRNYARGRADRAGAFTLAKWMFIIEMVLWVAQGHFTASPELFLSFLLAVAISLLTAALLWILYVAIEPYVRHHWPQSIISWSRLLAGRVSDPLVGRDVLWGVVLGTAWMLTFVVGTWFAVNRGAQPQFPTTEFLEGIRPTLGLWVQNIISGVSGTILFFLLLVVLRVLVRNSWVAAALFVVIWSVPQVLGSEQKLIAAAIWVIVYAIAAVAVVRFGLVVLAVATLMANLVLNVPYTTDLSNWYALNGVITLALFVALAAWGFYTALAGRKLWKEDLFE